MTGCTPVAWTRAVIAALVALGVVTGIGPAWAHTAMIASDPPANAALSAGPDRVSATFNEPLQTTFAAMTVVGPDANQHGRATCAAAMQWPPRPLPAY